MKPLTPEEEHIHELESEVARLREALEKAVVTFDDLERALGFLRHNIAAKAVRIAKDAARVALEGSEG